jgi:dihydrofolate reductase
VRKVIYSMGVSLDGFIARPDGDIGLLVPDEEQHRFHNQQAREMGEQLCGRRLYEVMAVWETFAEENPSAPEHELEFAGIWKETPKVVFSRTLERVEGNSRLVRDNVVDEVTRLKEQPGKDMAVGGAELAATFTRLGLIDEYRPFVNPVVLGGGTPYLPPMDEQIDLRLVETHKFGNGVVYLRYQRTRDAR